MNPWPAIRAAAAGRRDGLAGTVAELAGAGGIPRLGWVDPPPWPVARDRVGPPPDRLVLLGTGGWAFGARAAAEATRGPERLRVLDVLDPSTVDSVAVDRAPAVAVSESGRTTETRLLADACGGPVRWLTGDALWVRPAAPAGALFGAPVSVPFLLAASVAAGPELAGAYARFAASADRLGAWAGDAARSVDGDRLTLRLPPGCGPGLRLFVLQATRQGLCGKAGAALSWVDTGPAGVPLPVPDPDAHPLTAVMSVCYAAVALVACVGVRRGLRFAEHAAVDTYKALLGRARPATRTVEPDGMVSCAVAWLRERPGLTGGHLVRYDSPPAGLAARLAAESGRPWEEHRGSTWNHHSYQAVYHRPDLGVVAVAPAGTGHPLDRAQADLAAATCAALGQRALLLRAGGAR